MGGRGSSSATSKTNEAQTKEKKVSTDDDIFNLSGGVTMTRKQLRDFENRLKPFIESNPEPKFNDNKDRYGTYANMTVSNYNNYFGDINRSRLNAALEAKKAGGWSKDELTIINEQIKRYRENIRENKWEY